jgi:hypothetical protein
MVFGATDLQAFHAMINGVRVDARSLACLPDMEIPVV